MILSADFETTTDADDCRVWGWSYYSLEYDVTRCGNNFDDFMMNHIFEMPTNTVTYFHNLKFDGQFLFYWLFRNGFTHTRERKLLDGEFKTLISYMNQYYSIEIKYEGRTYIIYDSLKIIPLKVSKISKAFGIEQLKGTIDYKKIRPVGYEPTNNELDYMKNDVEIVGKALVIMFKEGLDRMTQASNALHDYKSTVKATHFKNNFPLLDSDSFLRESYKGGFTYVNPAYKDKLVKEGIVLDVNSLYPSVMYDCKLPYGDPIHFFGKPNPDKFYNIYIVSFQCDFELKKDHIPTVQIKNNPAFKSTEYLSTNGAEEVTLVMSNVDYVLFRKHYKVYNLEFIEGYKFRSSNKMFRTYIDKWTTIKIEADKSGNEGRRTIAKLMLNALYGKFGTNPLTMQKFPVWDGELVKFVDGDKEFKDPLYVALASFVTAYARTITIESAQENFDRYIYSDTDSIHLEGLEIPQMKIDERKLGYWKIEGQFTEGKFLRAKSYIEKFTISPTAFDKMDVEKQRRYYCDIGDKEHVHLDKITCAGMPDTCHDFIHFDNFKDGTKVDGKLMAKSVKGGVVLKDTTFTLKL